ncbi:hypothetical protein WMF26_11250 [Sorangium sp. So ce185]|uniref:hypothetical protein n=1 Tax=Sorangium sp. So ce185 TaxID=3133287 RepID=UPI003F5E510F
MSSMIHVRSSRVPRWRALENTGNIRDRRVFEPPERQAQGVTSCGVAAADDSCAWLAVRIFCCERYRDRHCPPRKLRRASRKAIRRVPPFRRSAVPQRRKIQGLPDLLVGKRIH